MFVKDSQEDFLRKAIERHGRKFDYSKTVYKEWNKKIDIICHKKDENGNEHGIFRQTPNSHTQGCGCKKCSIDLHKKLRRSNTNEFIEKARKVHKNIFDYKFVDYKNNSTNIIILCNICKKKFNQSPDSHLSGSGCRNCSNIRTKERMLSLVTNDLFVSRSKECHGDFYSYEKAKYINMKDKVIITCPLHGDFLCSPDNHIRGRGCKKCKMSFWEKSILKFLKLYGLNYDSEHRFSDCKNVLPLPFDFIVFNNDGTIKCLIEYQGEQHYEHRFWLNYGFSKKEAMRKFSKQKKRDLIKKKYCLNNNIKLICISYRDVGLIENIIKSLRN